MFLESLMEEKQLNFDKPLLSVRRFTSGATSVKDGQSKTEKSIQNVPRPPPYKSELKSGPVRNPGTVPFVWEQCPGKPKDETEPQTQGIVRSLIAPKLPPGRDLKADQQDTDNASAKLTANRNQVGNVSHGSRNSLPLDEDIRKCESPRATTEEAKSSSSGDGDEAYVDALNTLSRTESFFINCSMSGLSVLDDADIKTYGNSGMDPQTRDFMMGRFLPAAKAMASETPQHAPRKSPVVVEQPRQPKKVINADNRPRLRYGPNFMPNYSQRDDSGDDESDSDYDNQEAFPSKLCGLLPRVGLKSSFCLLNPLPGMSVRTQTPMSPLSRTQARSSSSGSCSELDSEQYQFDMSEKRSEGGLLPTKLQVNRNHGRNDRKQIIHQHNLKQCERMSPIRQLEVGNGNGLLQSHEHKAALSIPKKTKNSDTIGSDFCNRTPQCFQGLLPDHDGFKDLAEGSPVVEKSQSDLKERTELNPAVESSIDIDDPSIGDKAVDSHPILQKPVKFHVISLSDKANQDLNKDSIISVSQKVLQEESTQKAEKLDFQFEFPAPPPLPKSPTDSWLGRTLPSMSAKNASINSYLVPGTSPKYQTSNLKSSDPKWETIVRTTKMQHQHMRFSEEPLTPIPET